MLKSFKDSLKALEADIQLANTLASGYPQAYDGLLRILIYKVYVDGKTTMSVHERRATIREFYGVIFPSLLQLQRGITDLEGRKQKEVCVNKYRRKDDTGKGRLSIADLEREEECGICMEITSKIVLPNCCHCLCMRCYQDWRSRSQSCPFCRDSLKRVNSHDLWIYMASSEVTDLSSIARDSMKRLIMYVEQLPLLVPPDPTHISHQYPYCG